MTTNSKPDTVNEQIIDISRLIIEKGSKSFAIAARLFEPETRDNAYMLYGWCRYCDDQIDNQVMGFNGRPQSPEITQEILQDLRSQTRAAINNEPSDNPVFEALRYVLLRNEIPGKYPLELLEGFAMDAADKEYKTLDDTLLYCYYVAGVVGVMMTYIMGARDPKILQRAVDLGIAFQLTNIARDVREDAEIGRVYIPADWLREAGIPTGKLLEPEYSEALTQVVIRLLDEADRYYTSAEEGLRALGFRSAWAVASARNVYQEIGETVRNQGEQALKQRVVVRKRRKLIGLADGMIAAVRSSLLDRHINPPARDNALWSVAEKVPH